MIHIYKYFLTLWYPPNINIWLILWFWYQLGRSFDTNINIAHGYHAYTYRPVQLWSDPVVSKWMKWFIDAHLVKNVLFVQGVQLWSVENPLINHVNRLEKKVTLKEHCIVINFYIFISFTWPSWDSCPELDLSYGWSCFGFCKFFFHMVTRPFMVTFFKLDSCIWVVCGQMWI